MLPKFLVYNYHFYLLLFALIMKHLLVFLEHPFVVCVYEYACLFNSSGQLPLCLNRVIQAFQYLFLATFATSG